MINALWHVVLDTNVVVSAFLKSASIPGCLVGLCLDGLLVPVLDQDILTEYREVLARPKFHLPQDIIDDFLAGFSSRAVTIQREPQNLVLEDKGDLKFYEITMTHRKHAMTYLVTGNLRHFPVDDFIVSPRAMLNLIQQSAGV